MKSIKGLSISILVPFFLLSQSPPETLWTNLVGGEDEERGYSVQQTTDGGFIIAGLTLYPGLGGSDASLMKTDRDGSIVWTKTYGAGDFEEGRSVLEYSRGGYVLVGSAPSELNNSSDFYLVKTNGNGEVQWSRKYNRNYDEWAQSVAETDDGGLLILGVETWLSPGGGGCRDFIVRVDSTGDTLWTKSYLGGVAGPLWTYTCAYPRSLDETLDGGYIITGSHEQYVYLMKIDSAGDSLWTKNLYEGEGTSVKTTMDGGFIIAGYSYDPQRSKEVLLIRTDSEGNESWIKTLGTESDDEAYSVNECNDGGYIVVGSTGPLSTKDLYLIKTDINGDTVWTSRMGGPEWDTGQSIQQTDDGGYIVVGSTRSFGAGASGVWLIRLGQELSVHGSGSFVPEGFSLSQPYPNPFNPTTTIEFSVPQSGLITLQVYDLLGREIETILHQHMDAGHHKVQWNARNIPSGIYFVRMQVSDPSAGSAQGFTQVKKVTVLR